MPTRTEEMEQQLEEKNHLRQRRAVNNAYAALQGRQLADTFSAFTFEEAADAYLTEIEGAGTPTHPGKLVRVERVQAELSRAVEELKQLPPSTFQKRLSTNVNTPDADDEAWDAPDAAL